MTAKRKLRKILQCGAIFLVGRNGRCRPVKGLPAGVSFSNLSELCRQHFGGQLKDVSYVHLSGWKQAGSYRLLLQTNSGGLRSLVYKNVQYGQDHIPALTGLPVKPGVPEFLVYSRPRSALHKYLPRVYSCIEVTPGVHYKYILEDLGHDFHALSTPEERLRVVARLPTFHKALAKWSASLDQNLLLKYDHRFSDGLLKYVKENLQIYLQETAYKMVADVLKRWTEILAIRKRTGFDESYSLCPIHGDFNASNIVIHKRDPNQIKFIDWEWTGLGMLHADLASLLKGQTIKLERQAVEVYANRSNGLSLDQHKRIYQWCKLERGLFDAAFFAAQHRESPGRKKLNYPKRIASAMNRAIEVYKELI